MNQDERYGRHVERLKDWDEVEVQPTDISVHELEAITPPRPLEPGAFTVEASDVPGSMTAKLPAKSAAALQQNRFFVVGILFLLALVVMLFVLI